MNAAEQARRFFEVALAQSPDTLKVSLERARAEWIVRIQRFTQHELVVRFSPGEAHAVAHDLALRARIDIGSWRMDESTDVGDLLRQMQQREAASLR